MNKWNFITNSFDPSSVGNCVLWLDGNDSTTITLNGSQVSQWADKSGQADNLTQPTALIQPTYVTGYQNGLSVVQFIGDQTSGTAMTGTLTALVAQPFSVYIVAKIVGNDPTNAQDYLYDGVDAPSHSQFGLNSSGSDENTMFIYAGGSAALDATVNKTSWSQWNQYTTLIDDFGTDYIRQNGVQLASLPGNQLGTNPLSKITLGARFTQEAGFHLNGYIAEVLVFNTILSNTNRDNIERYLKVKWGL